MSIENTIKQNEAFQFALKNLSQKVTHVFVTGAGGFLGQAICKSLLNANIKVTGFARSAYPSLDALGVTMIQGDIANKEEIKLAMQGCDLVFHVASKAGVWGAKADYFEPNVAGAKNILDVCRDLNIKHLVYTSTPSVTFSGVDENGIDESQPYAKQYLNYYGESKAIAEDMVLKSNNENLKTIAIRPHLIWGPNDPHLVPRVLSRAKAGKLKLIGKEDKLVDTIYIDNAAYAHILAADALMQPKPICGGKAYFVSNDQPITMAQMLNKILTCANLPPVNKRVPSLAAYIFGSILERVYLMLGRKQEPILTKFVARQLSTSHYFNIDAAKRDLGYQPLVSISQGMTILKKSL
ncbi:2-alkyl-3-oxoalkanoate reductase [Pseudoalteromonas denitrificans]|uniref:Nucleoside-diphosphate-sugar epimerase n=1 Tax=Pseudoalteromonas denitrificans DSM 6059 TaxID=1123010 RepID=A0A1I1Q152_9GAMM|nr:2-alkyl-3-oxoalkanoate reductase [Pseudoalteromonas denitrificans]SFD13588.1 Nucleoside-diphosphate-sugar epimerase [Pseudoalteromonas denitrificans DSM 6059]